MKKEVTVEITNLPNEVFWRGQFIRDLPQLRLLSREEKRALGTKAPDVEVESLIFGKYGIPRSNITNNFFGTDGTKLKPSRLHTNKRYCVVAPLLQTISVGILPPVKGVQYALKGEPLLKAKGKYLVFWFDTNKNIDWTRYKILTEYLYQRMVKSDDTIESLTARVERHKKMEGMTAQQKFLNADFRIVARVENISTGKTIGFVLSFVKNGKMEEAPFNIQTVEKYAVENRIRNMTPKFQLTYGALNELPTLFMNVTDKSHVQKRS